MKHNKKLHKTLKIISIALSLIILIVILITGIDYTYYKLGNRSFIFNTLDNYRQDQILKFGNLDLKVNEVILKAYPEPTAPIQTDCSLISESTEEGFWNGLSKYRCEYALSKYPEDFSHYKAKSELIVEFEYSNISDQPINLADYSVKLIANTSLEIYGSPVTKCTGMSKLVFLNGYTEKECLSMDIDKGYNGPLALSVTRGGKEKIINLTIPETALLK